jgi:cell division protein FtsL
MRFMCIGAVLTAIASAVWLYTLNLATRRLAAEVAQLERSVETAESEIAVLRAERAYLSRPERIEPMARALGMRPSEPGQIVPASTLETASRLFAREPNPQRRPAP